VSLNVTRIWADADGETHLTDLELPTSEPAAAWEVARLQIPTTTMIYVEYPPGELEISPGFHRAPRRQLVHCLQGAFEVATTSGQRRLISRGDWIFADDVEGKGHTTRGVGADRRVNIAIGVPDDWVPPTV
jgi:hypothetical protein